MAFNDQGMGVGGAGGGLPPMLPDDLPDSGAKWPKVLGIFSIVLGSLSALFSSCGACFGLIGSTVLENFLRNLPKPNQPMPPGSDPIAGAEKLALMRPWNMAQGVMGLLGLALAAWLIVSGVWMVRRQVRAIGSHKAWAAAQIVMTVLSCALGVVSTVLTAEAQAEIDRNHGGTMTAGTLIAWTLAGTAVAFVFFIAYPIVVLIVLGKPWAKAEAARWDSINRSDESDPFAN